MGVRTPYKTVNFERSNNQSDDFIIFLKHKRMVIDIDGKNNSFEQFNQHFRLHPYVDRTNNQQPIITIPAEFFR
ncbi:unnamed protein product [Rotaria sp. Silwood1]|nr:unnamed protein product [Rotaria sp. Silwood1]CAF1638777.1 unnamed protein product [Rotaria sp. Silwood1]